jgi:hypothetical protein
VMLDHAGDPKVITPARHRRLRPPSGIPSTSPGRRATSSSNTTRPTTCSRVRKRHRSRSPRCCDPYPPPSKSMA